MSMTPEEIDAQMEPAEDEPSDDVPSLPPLGPVQQQQPHPQPPATMAEGQLPPAPLQLGEQQRMGGQQSPQQGERAVSSNQDLQRADVQAWDEAGGQPSTPAGRRQEAGAPMLKVSVSAAENSPLFKWTSDGSMMEELLKAFK